MLTEPIFVTLKVVRVFETLNIPYLIGGSLASAVHGMIRATLDADLVADIKQNHIPLLVDKLGDEFYIDPEVIQDAIIHKNSFNLIHLESMFKIDVFILKRRSFDINQMRRRVLHSLGETSEDQAFFSTAEDLVLAKLEWFKSGGGTSERQWRDILGILEVQGRLLDYAYMEKWSEKLGIRELLINAIRSASKTE